MNSAVELAAPSLPSRLSRMGKIFSEPTSVFEQEAVHPNAWLPFAIFVTVMAIEIVLISGPMLNVTLNTLPEAVRSSAAADVGAMIDRNRWFAIFLAPLIQGMRVLFLGCFIYAATVMAGSATRHFEEGTLHRAFSIAVYASFALIAEEAANVITIQLTGWENVRYFWELKPVVGLHYLLQDPGNHRVLFVALQRVNPFTVLYAFLIALGVRRVFGASRVAAWSMAIAANVGGIALLALLAGLRS
jgi:hypothetical protein